MRSRHLNHPVSRFNQGGLQIKCPVHAATGTKKRGKELEYRVIAINKAGEGAPSNIMTAVL